MRIFAGLTVLVLVLLAGVGSNRASDDEKAAILEIHERDRTAHLEGDAAGIAARVAPEMLSVADGEIKRQTREDVRKQLADYFSVAKHTAWEDVEPPLVGLSPDGKMAWAVYRVHSKFVETTAGGKKNSEFVAAWTSTYEKIDGRWLMTTVTSTFQPSAPRSSEP